MAEFKVRCRIRAGEPTFLSSDIYPKGLIPDAFKRYTAANPLLGCICPGPYSILTASHTVVGVEENKRGVIDVTINTLSIPQGEELRSLLEKGHFARAVPVAVGTIVEEKLRTKPKRIIKVVQPDMAMKWFNVDLHRSGAAEECGCRCHAHAPNIGVFMEAMPCCEEQGKMVLPGEGESIACECGVITTYYAEHTISCPFWMKQGNQNG